MRKRTTIRGVLAATLTAFAFSGAAVEAQTAPDVDEARLAMSAGPPAVSMAADVYVMGDRGFERVREGSNGFSCLVQRSAADPSVLAPHCLSPAATETVLPGMLLEGRLQAEGLAASEIQDRIERGIDAGRIPLPAGPAYAYMLSEGQQLGPAGKWRPHFMLYMPYVTNEDIGGDPNEPDFPFVGPVEGEAYSTVVIVMPEFVDPASLDIGR